MTADLLTLDEFLCGAEGPESWCRQHFSDYIEDIDTKWDPEELKPIRPEYYLAPSSDSILLLYKAGESFTVVGYYNTPGAVCIDDAHQGQGLGAELILATYEWCGCPPTSGLDEQCFTTAGYAAHQAAYRLGLERGIFVEHQSVRKQIVEEPEP